MGLTLYSLGRSKLRQHLKHPDMGREAQYSHIERFPKPVIFRLLFEIWGAGLRLHGNTSRFLLWILRALLEFEFPVTENSVIF